MRERNATHSRGGTRDNGVWQAARTGTHTLEEPEGLQENGMGEGVGGGGGEKGGWDRHGAAVAVTVWTRRRVVATRGDGYG